jgi:uncharacterized membrane protein
MSSSATADTRLARFVHRTLLTGVIASAALLIVGLGMALNGQRAQAEPVTDWTQLTERALAGDGRAVIDLGLVVLMFTPVLRVLVLACGWLAERKWRLALVSIAVAIMLGISIAVGVG